MWQPSQFSRHQIASYNFAKSFGGVHSGLTIQVPAHPGALSQEGIQLHRPDPIRCAPLRYRRQYQLKFCDSFLMARFS